jgi:protocatechuate 3,4-dioxygenase beta subunit
MKKILAVIAFGLLSFSLTHRVFAQSLGNAGTIEGNVVDPSGAAVAKAVVTLHNAVSGYHQTTTTASDGSFRFGNIPPNPYPTKILPPEAADESSS